MTVGQCCTISAIIGITIIEAMALYKGRNGKLFSLAVGALSGLGGFCLGFDTPGGLP